MAKRKKPSAYQKEMRRINRRIRALEKRGYLIPQAYKEELKGYSWQKLRTVKPVNIYAKAQYVNRYGTVMSGREGRAYERHRAAIKGKITREVNERIESGADIEYGEDYSYIYDDSDLPNIGEMVYNKLKALIETFPTAGADYLNKMLSSEISKYGGNAVIRSLAEAPESLIRDIEQEIYYESNKSKSHKTLKALADLIKGTVESESEAREIGQIQDAISYAD